MLEPDRIFKLKLQIPSVKIIYHVFIYDPEGSTWLLIFAYHPYMIGTFCYPEFSFREFSLCRSQENSHGPRNSEKVVSTKDFDKVPCCDVQVWHRRAFHFSRKCCNRGLIEFKNQRAPNKVRLYNAQRSPKNYGNSVQSFPNYENQPQYDSKIKYAEYALHT